MGRTISVEDAIHELTMLAHIDLQETEQTLAEEGRFVTKLAYDRRHLLQIFRVVLQEMKQLYRKAQNQPKHLEKIGSLMELVGEAAEKFDICFARLHPKKANSIVNTAEYRHLQEFYANKIVRPIEEHKIDQWMVALALSRLTTPVTQAPSLKETKHIFMDLDAVKRDNEYELFLIRRPDGSRFFSPKLLKNLELVCKLENYFGDTSEKMDLFSSVPEERDHLFASSAKKIRQVLGPDVADFYSRLRKCQPHELSPMIHKTLMALMLAGYEENLLVTGKEKCCTDYFADFQRFLDVALHHNSYQSWLAYPPKEPQSFAAGILHLLQSMCAALYTNGGDAEKVVPFLQKLTQQALGLISQEHTQSALDSRQDWSFLARDAKALTKAFQTHAHGPLKKILHLLKEGNFPAFHPFLQGFLPYHLFQLHRQESVIPVFTAPCPTIQECIHECRIDSVFRGFLDHYASLGKVHLFLNFQDRTSWKEHARCQEMEQLQFQGELSSLVTVTFATDTDFYHQSGVFAKEDRSSFFLSHFLTQLFSDEGGFFFPPSIPKERLTDFLQACFLSTHEKLFEGKPLLPQEQRLQFIDYVYCSLMVKLVEWVHPSSVGLYCKDGVDTSPAYGCSWAVFLHKLHEPDLPLNLDLLNAILHGPALLGRERPMLAERLDRCLHVLRLLET